MGALRINGSIVHGWSFKTRHSFQLDRDVITGVELPRQLATHVTGVVHVSNQEDVPFGDGVWLNGLEGIMLQLTRGAPAGAHIRYKVRVGTSSLTKEEGFDTSFCSEGKFGGTRGQWRPLQSLCIDIVWPGLLTLDEFELASRNREHHLSALLDLISLLQRDWGEFRPTAPFWPCLCGLQVGSCVYICVKIVQRRERKR
jgi:hypothetical protein